MGRALRDGANGISPTALREDQAEFPRTEATSLLTRARAGGTGRVERSTKSAAAVTPRRPRSGPPRQAPARPTPRESSERVRRARGRALLALLTLLVVIAAIAAIVVVTAPSQTKVKLRNVVYSDVQHASQALQELVSENTR